MRAVEAGDARADGRSVVANFVTFGAAVGLKSIFSLDASADA